MDALGGASEPSPEEEKKKKKKPLKIISRSEWKAEAPHYQTNFADGAVDVKFSFTDGDFCSTKKECGKVLRKLQKEHMDRGMPDIAYNFLIGGDLNVYEGRGWRVIPQASDVTDVPMEFRGSRDLTAFEFINIAYIGGFEECKENLEMTDVANDLVVYGFESGLIGDERMRQMVSELKDVDENKLRQFAEQQRKWEESEKAKNT